MPLPLALQQRLAKRGLVKVDSKKKEEVEEEVFAEDYDDVSQTPEPPPPPVETTPKKEKPVELIYDDKGIIVHHVTACPNKSNPYHECIDFCRKTWGLMRFQHKKDLDLKREKMLAKYPLTDDWLEVADPMSGRYYYWHIDTEEVSWFPPGHAKCKITQSADKLNDSVNEAKAYLNKLKDGIGADRINLTQHTTSGTSDAELEKRMDRKDNSKDRHKDKTENKDKYKQRRKEVRNKKDKAGIDPMDPASYSDISVGDWSSGLDQRGMAKTGVDSSATGELFQQRPYPSPGDILRANKALEKKEESDDEDDELDH